MKENFGGVSAAPLGAGYSKIAAGAVPQPRLALPSRWRLVLGCRARPPGRAAYICGPASVRPLRKRREGFCDRRRGGCPHPPAQCFECTRVKPQGRHTGPPGFHRSAGGPRASPTQPWKNFLKTVGEGLAPPAGRSRTGPYAKNAPASLFVVGAAHWAARRFIKTPAPDRSIPLLSGAVCLRGNALSSPKVPPGCPGTPQSLL